MDLCSAAFGRWNVRDIYQCRRFFILRPYPRLGKSGHAVFGRPYAHSEPVLRIEFRPNYICFPVALRTKPPRRIRLLLNYPRANSFPRPAHLTSEQGLLPQVR